MALPKTDPNFYAIIEQDAATRERERMRLKKADEIRRKDAERAAEREREREAEAQALVASIKEHWRTKMRETMPEESFEQWWRLNKLRILEEEARARDAAISAGTVGSGYGAM